MDDWITTIRSLGFGAMLGSGLVGLFYVAFPDLFPGASSLREVAILGALIGGGAHRLVDEWVIRGLLAPVARYSGFYSRLLQLVVLRPLPGRRHQHELVRDLIQQFFLGGVERRGGGRNLLPPP